MSDTITVVEDGRPITIGFAELEKYHGHGFPGGIAHGLKVMQRAFPLLDDGIPLERREVSIRTAFGGPGLRDAVEMVTRAVTENRYTVDPALALTERGVVLQNYVFFVGYRGRTVRAWIHEGHVRTEFIALGRQPQRTPAEEARLTTLKREMANRLLAAVAEDIYDAALLE